MRQIDVFKTQFIENIEEIKLKHPVGLKDYLYNSKNKNYQIDTTSSKEEQRIIFYDDIILKKIAASDYINFAISSFQSIGRTSSIGADKNLAWGLIQSYYASFYAAHAIMRICGFYFVNINKSIALNIDQVSGPLRPHDFSSGDFLAEFDCYNRQIYFHDLGRIKSHEDLWHQFLIFIDKICRNFADKKIYGSNSLIISLQNLKSILELNRKGAALSQFRNDINYLSNLDYWHPKQTKNNKLDLFLQKKDWWKKGIEDFNISVLENFDQNAFLQCTHFLVCLCREIYIEIMNSKYKNNFCKTHLDLFVKSL